MLFNSCYNCDIASFLEAEKKNFLNIKCGQNKAEYNDGILHNYPPFFHVTDFVSPPRASLLS